MVRIAIRAEAFEAIAKTLPVGSLGYEEQGEREGRKAHLAGKGGCRPAALAARPRRVVQRCDFAPGSGGLRARKANAASRAPCNALPEALDPLGQRLRTRAERRVHRRFVSAQRLVAGHDAFGQGVLGEVRAQARHSVGEVAHVYADERALFCPGQLFLTALHAAESLERLGAGPFATRAKPRRASRRSGCSGAAGRPLGPSQSRAARRR